MSDLLSVLAASPESSVHRAWCVEHDHPGTTFNPCQGKTWCACGQVITEGDTATHELCCGVTPDGVA